LREAFLTKSQALCPFLREAFLTESQASPGLLPLQASLSKSQAFPGFCLFLREAFISKGQPGLSRLLPLPKGSLPYKRVRGYRL
jgi:hypothetical protein